MLKTSRLKIMAAAIITVCAVLVCAASGYSASRSAVDPAVQLIIQHYALPESNPIYKEEAKHLNALFQDVLTRRKQLSVKEQPKIYCESIMSYSLSACHKFELEDSVDNYRTKMRGSIALATAALTSTPKEALHYFELAKITLLEDSIIYDYGAEVNYAALLLLEGLYRSEHKLLHPAKKKSLLRTLSGCRTLSAQQKNSFVDALRALK